MGWSMVKAHLSQLLQELIRCSTTWLLQKQDAANGRLVFWVFKMVQNGSSVEFKKMGKICLEFLGKFLEIQLDVPFNHPFALMANFIASALLPCSRSKVAQLQNDELIGITSTACGTWRKGCLQTWRFKHSARPSWSHQITDKRHVGLLKPALAKTNNATWYFFYNRKQMFILFPESL